MRLFPFFIVALVPLTMGALIACESESTNNPSPINVDASTVDVGTTPPGQDAAPADVVVPATGVTVTVFGATGPASGVVVVFHDASGAVLETKKTGADGKATSTGAVPAMATALLSKGGTDLITWTGLEAGDELSANDINFSATGGSYDVSLSAPFAGAARYEARFNDNCSTVGLWDGAAARNHILRYECVRKENNAIVVDALTGTTILARALAKGLAAPGATPLAATVGAFAAPTNVTVTTSNTPPNSNVVSSLEEIAGSSSIPTPDVTPGTFATAAGFADALQPAAYASVGASSVILAQRVASPFPNNTFTLDFANSVPLISNGTKVLTDPRRPELSWTAASPLTGTDGGLVQLEYSIGGDTSFHWTFVVPPGTTSVKAPALPAEGAEYLPTGDGGLTYSALQVVFLESDLIPSYTVFRRQQATFFPRLRPSNIPALPTTGYVRMSYWYEGS